MNKRIVFICMSVIAQRAVTGARAAPTERTFCPPSLVGYWVRFELHEALICLKDLWVPEVPYHTGSKVTSHQK